MYIVTPYSFDAKLASNVQTLGRHSAIAFLVLHHPHPRSIIVQVTWVDSRTAEKRLSSVVKVPPLPIPLPFACRYAPWHALASEKPVCACSVVCIPSLARLLSITPRVSSLAP